MLEAIAGICDLKSGIRRFRLPWQGELTELLPYSLLFKFYEKVRVSLEGELNLWNYSQLAAESPEKMERESGCGVQKAINIRSGIVGPSDAEDIEIYILDEKIRSYLEWVMAKTGLSDSHPCFQEMYDFYLRI